MFKLLNQPSLSHYTYVLINPTTDKPFYVGKGTGTRYLDHFKEAITNKTHNKYKTNTIRKILNQNQEILIEIVFESNNEKECYDEEIELIKFHGRKNNKTGILTNLTDGGEGGSWKHSEIHKQSLRLNNPGGKATSKSIYQIDTSGQVIKQWVSTRKAGVGTGIKSWRNISQAANKYKTRIVGGFYWRWIGDSDVVNFKLSNIDLLNQQRTKPKQTKQVKQTSLSGDQIKVWDTMSSAARSLKIKVSGISLAAKKLKPYAGFLWKL